MKISTTVSLEKHNTSIHVSLLNMHVSTRICIMGPHRVATIFFCCGLYRLDSCVWTGGCGFTYREKFIRR